MKKNIIGYLLSLAILTSAINIKCNAENLPLPSSNDTQKNIEKINKDIEKMREDSWSKLSPTLEKASKDIMNNPKISKPEIEKCTQLWVKAVKLNENRINSVADNCIKQLDKLESKNNLQNPIYISESKQLMSQDYNKFLLEKMSQANFVIYTGFWLYNLHEYLSNTKIITAAKTDFLYVLLKRYLSRKLTESNKDKCLILITEMKKLGNTSIIEQLVMLRESITNTELQANIDSIIKISQKK